MFNYKDKVKIEDGFYEGHTGKVVDVSDYEGTDTRLVGTKVYKVKITIHSYLNEKDLSRISLKKVENEEEEND